MTKNIKKYILSVETTNKISGVALLLNNEIIDSSDLDLGLNHSITLFTNIDNILTKNNICIDQIDSIKVSCGPGSFTGIRIGIAAALGLSIKNNIKIEYVDTLDSLAINVKNHNDYVLSMIDAKANRVYTSLYDSKTLKKLSSDTIININDLINLLNKEFKNKNISFALVGDGVVNYTKVFKSLLKINYNLYINESNFSGKSVGLSSGIISKRPIINYMMASKAERERNDKC